MNSKLPNECFGVEPAHVLEARAQEILLMANGPQGNSYITLEQARHIAWYETEGMDVNDLIGRMRTHGAPQRDPSPYYVWRPLPDITVYELAVCLPSFMNHGLDIDGLPDEVKRHFALVTPGEE